MSLMSLSIRLPKLVFLVVTPALVSENIGLKEDASQSLLLEVNQRPQYNQRFAFV